MYRTLHLQTRVVTQYPNNIAPISQYFTDPAERDAAAGGADRTGLGCGTGRAPTNNDAALRQCSVGRGVLWETLINGLMQSSSWSSSAFILTFDEGGGFYDHVSPQPAVSPQWH